MYRKQRRSKKSTQRAKLRQGRNRAEKWQPAKRCGGKPKWNWLVTPGMSTISAADPEFWSQLGRKNTRLLEFSSQEVETKTWQVMNVKQQGRPSVLLLRGHAQGWGYHPQRWQGRRRHQGNYTYINCLVWKLCQSPPDPPVGQLGTARRRDSPY